MKSLFAPTLCAIFLLLGSADQANAGCRCCICRVASGGQEGGRRNESNGRFTPTNSSSSSSSSSNGTNSSSSSSASSPCPSTTTVDPARVATQLEFLRLQERVALIEAKLKIQTAPGSSQTGLLSEILALTGHGATGRLAQIGDAALERLLARVLHESERREAAVRESGAAGSAAESGRTSVVADLLGQERALLELENHDLEVLISRRNSLTQALRDIEAEIPATVNRSYDARGEVASTIEQQRAAARTKFDGKRAELLKQLPPEIQAKLKK